MKMASVFGGVIQMSRNVFLSMRCWRLAVFASQQTRAMKSFGGWLGVRASELSVHKPLPQSSSGCPICSRNITFTYKDVLFLSQFLSPEGYLLNRRITGVCKKQQRKLEKTVKISRRLGLLPHCGPITSKKTVVETQS